LKHLQVKTDDLEEAYKKEEDELIKKYQALKNPFYARRSEIVTGKSEPTAEELVDVEKEKEKEATTETKTTNQTAVDVKGIPEFWLEALKHHPEFASMVTSEDEVALKHLTDVTSGNIKDEEKSTPSFELEFHFEPNEFFDNTVLKKTYYLTENRGDVLFDHIDSTPIKWKHGKNLTKKFVTKQQKVKGGRGGRDNRRGGKPQGGATKSITVEEDVESFFRFFQTPTIDDVEDEQDLQDALESDYEFGLMIREQFIPDAVLFFTGEFEDPYGGGEEGEFDGGEDEDGEGEQDYNSDEDADFDPKTAPKAEQPECKQQ